MDIFFKDVSNCNGLCVSIVFDSKIPGITPKEIVNGGDPHSPLWDKYLSMFLPERQQYISLIADTIRENGLVGAKSKIAIDYYFGFNDGVNIAFTARAWGDLMQAIVNRSEGYLKYYL